VGAAGEAVAMFAADRSVKLEDDFVEVVRQRLETRCVLGTRCRQEGTEVDLAGLVIQLGNAGLTGPAP